MVLPYFTLLSSRAQSPASGASKGFSVDFPGPCSKEPVRVCLNSNQKAEYSEWLPGLVCVVFLVSEQLIQLSVSAGVEREKCWLQASCVINPTLTM